MFKKLTFLFLCLSLVCFSNSCKKEQQNKPGLIFITMHDNSTSGVTAYNDNNSGLPSGFSWGTSYGSCQPGTYTFSVTFGNGIYCASSCEYTLTAPNVNTKKYYDIKLQETNPLMTWTTSEIAY